jgi:hypothetical protein
MHHLNGRNFTISPLRLPIPLDISKSLMKPKNPAVMRLLPLLLSLISFTAFAQKTVLIQSIQIQNDYDEVAANPFGKPESEAAFLQALEQKLQERLGPVAVEYLNEQKIILMDRAVVSRDPMAAIESFQALHRAKRTFRLSPR